MFHKVFMTAGNKFVLSNMAPLQKTAAKVNGRKYNM